ncbi:MAG: agmatine deiminase family protein, partial [Gammaproteobacteria bacterium]
FVTRPGGDKLAAIDFEFDAWGGKYPPYDLDNAIPARMAEALAVPCYKADFILEGGSIDVNGTGLALTTEQCLLNPNRNPHLSRTEIEQRLRAFLGIEKVLWLGEGILGDDTDGHVDDLTRFVSANTVVTVVEKDPDDDNFAPLQDNLLRLRSMTDLVGRPLTIKTLPMPAPVYYDGTRLPASYANFYIANRVVLVPFFNDPMDAAATDIIQSCFPRREIIGIDCTDLVWGLGAFHCLTQQVPAV